MYSGIVVSGAGIMKVNSTSPNSRFLPGNSKRAKAKPAIALALTLKKTVEKARIKVLSTARVNNPSSAVNSSL